MIDLSTLPKGKQTAPGLYITAADAHAQWQPSADTVHIIDGNGDSGGTPSGGWKHTGCPRTNKLAPERMILP